MNIHQLTGFLPMAADTSTDKTSEKGGTSGTSGDLSAFGLKKDDFFKLFLAQLKNQDPTNAMDDNQMVAQLAQFSMIEMLQQLTTAMNGSRLSQASSLIGRTVTGTDGAGAALTGVVDHVEQTDTGLLLHIGTKVMAPEKVTDVGPTAAPVAAAATSTTGSNASTTKSATTPTDGSGTGNGASDATTPTDSSASDTPAGG